MNDHRILQLILELKVKFGCKYSQTSSVQRFIKQLQLHPASAGVGRNNLQQFRFL